MGHRILGAFVKSAVNTAAIKQIEAADMVPLFGCTTSWQGKQAFATWVRNPAGYMSRHKLYRPDGSRRTTVKFRINYPAMPDDALLTRREADLIAAFTLHETGHVLYTNNRTERTNTVNPLPRLHMLANGFEDARMEATVIMHGARNARSQFQQLLNKLTGDIGASFNPCDLSNAPFAVALLGREALGNGNTYTSQLLARIPEPQRSIYAKAMGWFASAPMGYDTDFWSYHRADLFLQLWDAMRAEQKPEQPEQPEPGEQPEQPEQDEQGEEPSQPEDDEQDDEGGAPAPYELDDQPEQPEQPNQPKQPADDGEDDEGSEDDEDGGDPSDGQSDEDAEPEEKDNGKPFSDRNDSGEFKSPEPSIDDLIKRINKRTDSDLDVKLSAFSPASRDTDIMQIIGV